MAAKVARKGDFFAQLYSSLFSNSRGFVCLLATLRSFVVWLLLCIKIYTTDFTSINLIVYRRAFPLLWLELINFFLESSLSLRVYTCVYVFVYICMCMFVCLCVCTMSQGALSMYVNMWHCVSVYVKVYLFILLYTCVSAWECVFVLRMSVNVKLCISVCGFGSLYIAVCVCLSAHWVCVGMCELVYIWV